MGIGIVLSFFDFNVSLERQVECTAKELVEIHCEALAEIVTEKQLQVLIPSPLPALHSI